MKNGGEGDDCQPSRFLKKDEEIMGFDIEGVVTSLPCMASKSMTAALVSYPSAPAWVMNPFTAIDSSQQKES